MRRRWRPFLHVAPLSRAQRFFTRFCLQVAKGFLNSAPLSHTIAAALAYQFAGADSGIFVVLNTIRHHPEEDDGQRVNHFVDRLLISMTPASRGSHPSPLPPTPMRSCLTPAR